MTTQRKNNRTKVFTIRNDDITKKIEIQTLHFNFSETIVTKLSTFADIHRNDDRKMFKESWAKWIKSDDIYHLIETEIEAQRKKGFIGDVYDKMFKSARYYFRKKPHIPAKKAVRKQYISLCPHFLAKIDRHALELIKSHSSNVDNKCKANVSPANAYTSFCNTHQQDLYEQIEHLVNLLEYSEICDKMKKTYKNRFHLMKLNVENMYTNN